MPATDGCRRNVNGVGDGLRSSRYHAAHGSAAEFKNRKMKIGLIVLVLAIVAAALLYVDRGGAGAGTPEYRLAPVTRGPIASTVAASGTLNAVVTVDVGTQVSGLVKTLHADFNSRVTAGQIIARIDSAPFEAVLSQAEAELTVARANVAIQEASLAEVQADLDGHRAALTEAGEELRRKRAIAARGAVSSSVVDTALALHEQASAKVKAGMARLVQQQAQIELARAKVLQATATVQQKQLDLDYTYIRSPVDGVVIRRDVNAGQTVASSLQAPVLFRIAEDLARMQVSIRVDEADIGRIREGQQVDFTVDTFPGQTFTGRVHQVRLDGQELSNVVTYTVVASADNADLRLLPGMTATASIVVAERADALKTTNRALRLRLHDGGPAAPEHGDWVWVLGDDGRPLAVPVQLGISDGNESEILGGDLAEGQRVITGVAATASGSGESWLRRVF